MSDPEAALAEYNSHVAEGGVFEQSGNYEKAIICYTKAIDAVSSNGVLQQPIAIHCLCSRSKCYLALGDPDLALADAETCLKEDKDFIKGLYGKAEALYFKGDFEFALVFFHRGHQLRPDMDMFRLGVQKSREAIDNAIGSTERCHLHANGDLSAFYSGLQGPGKGKKGKAKTSATTAGRRRQNTTRGRSAQRNGPGSERTTKQLLGELYADKAYLEELMNDPSMALGRGDDVKTLAGSGIRYLDKRTEFWRQQKPIYARVNEQKAARTARQTIKSTRNIHEIQRNTDRAVRMLTQADKRLEAQRDNEAREIAEKVIDMLHLCDEKKRNTLEAEARGVIGSVYLNADDLNNALREHEADLRLCREEGNAVGLNRALGNVGRVYARQNEMEKAIETWEEKAKICRDALENAWLHHEIGRAHLTLEHTQAALDSGSKSLEYADTAGDSMWQLRANLLIAQAQASLGHKAEAVKTYGIAEVLAESNAQEDLLSAIQAELADLKAQAESAEAAAPETAAPEE